MICYCSTKSSSVCLPFLKALITQFIMGIIGWLFDNDVKFLMYYFHYSFRFSHRSDILWFIDYFASIMKRIVKMTEDMSKHLVNCA